MNNKRLRHLLMSYTPKLTLMLCAIGPVTDNTEWLFYACCVCIFLLFLLAVVYVVTECIRDHKKVLSFAFGSPRDNIDYSIISMVGIITELSVGRPEKTIIWVLLLIFSCWSLYRPYKGKA